MAKSALQKLQNHYARYNTLDQMIVGLDYIEQKLYTDALNIFDRLVLESEGMGTIYKDALPMKGFSDEDALLHKASTLNRLGSS